MFEAPVSAERQLIHDLRQFLQVTRMGVEALKADRSNPVAFDATCALIEAECQQAQRRLDAWAVRDA
jgi:hypothetical protein